MGGKTSRTSRVAAFILLSVNLFFMAICLLMFAVSIWIISSPSSMASAIHSLGNPTLKALLPREVLSVQLGVTLAFLSGYLFTLSFMGVYGATTRSPFILFMYSIIALLMLMLECALLFYFSSGLLEKGLQENDGQWTHGLRLIFQCCEFNATSLSSQRLPWSCCGSAGKTDDCSIENVFAKDCHQTISHWIHKYQTVIYTSLAVVHIVLSSCSLLRRSRRASISYS